MSANRLLSALLACIYIVLVLCIGSPEAAFKVGLFVVLPLGRIWYAEAMGGYIGPVWRGAITSPTPASLVCIAGWVLLLVPLVVGIVYALVKA